MLRILLVDDEPLVLIGLQGMLEWEKRGYTVCGTARNGKLALELIEREKPDIVIADVKMPVMDGLEAVLGSRALDRPDANSVPIIAMTANAFSEDVARSRKAGMTEHLSKPLNAETLKKAILRNI